jgi:hypothetical protein
VGRLAALTTGVIVGVDQAVIMLLGARRQRAMRHAAAIAARVIMGMNQAVIVIVVHRRISG